MLLVPRRPFILAKAPEPTRLPLAKADKYGQELSGVAGRAVWRLDKWPERFPRLRYRGFLSTGNVKGVMEGLGWRQIRLKRLWQLTSRRGKAVKDIWDLGNPGVPLDLSSV